jgi:hypothetical protein
MRRRFRHAAAGQWIDSPSGRVARAQEIDAAWQQLWRDQYTRHVPERLRQAFTEDYRAWQRTKEQIANMSSAALMLPATGELLERWTTKARSWTRRFKTQGVEPSAPAIAAPAPHFDATRFAWAVAAGLGALALGYALTKVRGRA